MTDRNKLAETAKAVLLPALGLAAEKFFSGARFEITDQVGYDATVMEAALRPLWGIGPILKDGLTLKVGGREEKAEDIIREIMLRGTDEDDPLCFSKYAERDIVGFANKSATELAGYAVALYFARDLLWEPYTEEQKRRVGGWLSKWASCGLQKSWENNHFWFPLIVLASLERIGVPIPDVCDDVSRAFSVLDSMYISDGWYQDGVFGRFDYYLPWSLHLYPLLWSVLANGTAHYDPTRAAEYKRRAETFIPYYLKFFDRDGSVPAMGRSLAYRFAESAVFPAAAFAGCEIPNGVCRRAMMKNVAYFTEAKSRPGLLLKPGYLYQSSPLTDSYTSELGSLWCSKTFLALALGEDHPFWREEEKPLPSEEGAYFADAEPHGIDITVASDEKSGVTLYNNTSSYYQGDFGHTFNDMAACYCKFVYNSRSGFGISIPDKASSDNMISLLTPEFTMSSHRRKYLDLGRDGDLLLSEHSPFENDPDTVIRTVILPLSGSLHVRAHRVTLSRPYRVREGGYSIGIDDDSYEYENGVLRYRDMISQISPVSDTEFRLRLETHTPERHIIAPQSKYPVYETGVLPAGEYIFASAVSFSQGAEYELPELSLKKRVLTVVWRGEERKIKLI